MLIGSSVFCGCQFRRIEAQDDQSEAIRDAMSLEKIVGQAAPGTPKKRKRLTESIPSEEVGPSDFKKIRLMCSQRLHHTHGTEKRPILEQQHRILQEATEMLQRNLDFINSAVGGGEVSYLSSMSHNYSSTGHNYDVDYGDEHPWDWISWDGQPTSTAFQPAFIAGDPTTNLIPVFDDGAMEDSDEEDEE